jgi:3-dehydroquinate synthase
MKTLSVELGARSYPIHIGDGLLARSELLAPHVEDRKIMVVSNETVAPLYLTDVARSLAGHAVSSVVLPDGEVFKTLDVLNRIFDALLERRFSRDCCLLALGGGVIGDITGFAAACYQRGVAHIQVPTTLLAQVDSSVGGKTAVNHRLGKNMIGAFHQPSCVLIDTATLGSLAPREYRSGLAEVIKYGLIRDPELFSWLESGLESLLAHSAEAMEFVIERSCRNKAEIVAEDERESGPRALLNLGHTFGHAIETGLGYGVWLHGEAVAAGICLAAAMSARLGWISDTDCQRVTSLVERAGLPTGLPEGLDDKRVLALMGVDKKVMAGRLRLVLLKGIGHALVSDDFDPDVLKAILAETRFAA